ncbi:MAG: helix-turn-helix domain-containing protein [Streptosporangiales bacterium]
MTSADITGALARTMQSLRTERGWSLDQLAARSGVSKGVLVALEQGRSNPNLATLAKVADAFGVPLTRLLERADDTGVQITGPGEARQLWRGPNGGTGTILAATEPPWAAELWHWTVQPGESWGGEAHTPATRELVWVQAGTLALTVAGVRYEIGPGECARFPGGLPHTYRNEGTLPVSLTMIVVVPPALT